MNKYIPFLLLLCIVSSCANIKAPTGGSRDSEGPVLVSAVPESQGTDFRGQSFSLTFNEWIQLRDIRNQLVVSPPLKTPPEVRLKKRTVTVSWTEALKENTTYSFYFGDGVQDFTEGNSAEQLSYVFSTGPVLDSLEITGKLVTAQKGEAMANLKVFAYASSGDSLALNTIPDYFAEADKDGRFRIAHMRPGDYEVVAIGDENRNYFLDEGEQVGFHPDRIQALPADTLENDVVIKCNPQPAFVQYLKAYEPDSSGHIALVPSKVSDAFIFRDLGNPDRRFIQTWNPQLDSLHCWVEGDPTNSRLEIEVADGPEILDTLSVPFFDRDDRNLDLEFLQQGEVDGRSWIGLKASGRIDSTQVANVLLTLDTTTLEIRPRVNPLDPREVRFKPGVRDGSSFNLVLLPGALKSVEKWTNRDTAQASFRSFASEDFADLTIKLTGFHSPEALLFHILDDKNQIARTLKAEEDESLVANRLAPGAYNVRWLDDRNGNGRWDGCDYLGRVPSEEVGYFPEAIQARSNWVLDVEWIVKE